MRRLRPPASMNPVMSSAGVLIDDQVYAVAVELPLTIWNRKAAASVLDSPYLSTQLGLFHDLD